MLRLILRLSAIAIVGSLPGAATAAAAVDFQIENYSPQCAVRYGYRVVERELVLDWRIADDHAAYCVLDVSGEGPLIRRFGTVKDGSPIEFKPIAEGLAPALYLTVGSREVPRGEAPRKPQYVFFDNPHQRPHETFRSADSPKRLRLTTRGTRAVFTVEDVEAGPFRGRWELTFFPGSPIFKIEAVVATEEPARSFVYDLGLLDTQGSLGVVEYVDVEDQVRRRPLNDFGDSQSLRVRHRILAAESRSAGSLAVFPPPHKFFFPRDSTDNLAVVWCGFNHFGLGEPSAIGVRQAPTGGGNWVPWCDAPAGSEQRLGMFVLLSAGKAEEARAAALRYTRGDRFAELPEQTTFTSHYHMAIGDEAARRPAKTRDAFVPEWVDIFKRMNVQIVHMGEFHGDGHPKDPGPLRLTELEKFFRECRRLSDDKLLVIPGEEIGQWLGNAAPGRQSGHWMSLFPREVYWIQKRADDAPWRADDPKYGTVYRVESREDMRKLIAAEDALVWTAHPRIKASSWAPDAFRNEAFYKDASWLGAAWKAMPADLSEPRLGRRCLDLLDDMCNWGERKYLPGEVDVFKINHTHELYGHMNVNYLRLPTIPRYADGWKPVMDALRTGAFFTTTGEVLIREFTVGGKQSGETLAASSGSVKLRAEIEGTFPLRFAEIISGDGGEVYRERIDLSDTKEFASKTIQVDVDLAGRRWVRFEVWDEAVNGAYTQPVWLE